MHIDSKYAEIDFPRYFQVETIRECNSRCVFCPHGTENRAGQKKRIMSDRLYEKVEKELIEHAPVINRIAMHSFGEPLMDPNIAERIARLKKGGIREISIATNVSLLNEDWAKRLLKAGLDIARLSISTINPDKYRKLRVGLNFDAVMQNAQRYISLRDSLNPDSRIYVTMEKHDILSTEDIEAWKNHWMPLLKPGDMLKISNLFDYLTEDKKCIVENETRVPCHGLFQSMMIDYNGDVPLCTADSYASVIVGDVNSDSLESVWKGNLFSHYRELHRMGRRKEISLCNKCDMWEDCSKENIIF